MRSRLRPFTAAARGPSSESGELEQLNQVMTRSSVSAAKMFCGGKRRSIEGLFQSISASCTIRVCVRRVLSQIGRKKEFNVCAEHQDLGDVPFKQRDAAKRLLRSIAAPF